MITNFLLFLLFVLAAALAFLVLTFLAVMVRLSVEVWRVGFDLDGLKRYPRPYRPRIWYLKHALVWGLVTAVLLVVFVTAVGGRP